MRMFVLAVVLAAGCARPAAEPAAAPVPVTVDPPADTGPKVEAPVYTRWAKHKPGTTVVFTETTENPGQPTVEQVTTYTLRRVFDDRATVQVTVAFREADGKLAANPSQDFEYHRWRRPQPGQPAEPDERPPGTVRGPEAVKLTAAGKEYAARLYMSKGHVEAGPTETRTWLADDVPGGLLKSVTTVIPTKRVTTSVVSTMTLVP